MFEGFLKKQICFADLRKDFQRLFSAGVIHVLVTLFALRGVSIIQQVGLARILHQGDLGKAIFILRTLNIVCVFASLGVQTSLFKFSAENISEKGKRDVYFSAVITVLMTSSIVSAIYFLVVNITNAFGENDVLFAMLFCTIYIPLVSLKAMPILFLQAQKKIKEATLISASLQVVWVVLILLSAYFYGFWGYLSVFVFGQFFVFVAFALYTKKDLFGGRFKWDISRRLLHYGSFSFLANFSGIINSSMGVIMLKWFDYGFEEVAVYGVAIVIIEGMRMVPKSLLQTVFPYLVSVKDDAKALNGKVVEIRKKQGFVVFLMSILVGTLGWWLIPFAFGDFYSASWPCVVVMSGALVLWSIGAPYGQLQMALNNVQLNFYISACQLFVNFVFSIVLTPLGGAVGVASALLLSRCLHCFLQIYFGRKTLDRLIHPRFVNSSA